MSDTGLTCTFDPEEYATRWDEDDVPPMVAYWWGCAAKYVWRWPYKGATPSERARGLRKAVECLTECERAYTAHVAAQRAKVAAMVGEVD